jgi:hypothetical protein
MNLYYVVEKETSVDDNFEFATGSKLIRLYEVSTSLLELVIVSEIESYNFKNTETEIETWLENNDYEDDYNLIRL